MRQADLLRSMYRTSAAETQRDWSVLRSFADKTAQALPSSAKASDLEALVNEYLVAVFMPGSVVEVRDTRGVSSSELTTGQAV